MRRRDGEEGTQGLRSVIEREVATGFLDLGGGEGGREGGRGRSRERRGRGGGGGSKLAVGLGLLVVGQGPSDFFFADQGIRVEFEGVGVHFPFFFF